MRRAVGEQLAQLKSAATAGALQKAGGGLGGVAGLAEGRTAHRESGGRVAVVGGLLPRVKMRAKYDSLTYLRMRV